MRRSVLVAIFTLAVGGATIGGLDRASGPEAGTPGANAPREGFSLEKRPAEIRPAPPIAAGRDRRSAEEEPGIKIVLKRDPKSKERKGANPRASAPEPTPVQEPVEAAARPADERSEQAGDSAPAAAAQQPGLLESLRLAEEPPQRSLGGAPPIIETSSSSSSRDDGDVRPAPTPVPEEPPAVELLPKVGGQPRGYAMLYLMQPTARRTVEREIDTILRARLGQHYLGVLTDGTFGRDLDYLASVIVRLSGSPLTLALYLTNGATMRKWDQTPITAGFNQMEPEQFRYSIRYDPAVRERFRSMVEDVKPLFDLNRRLNPGSRNIAIVMLEDNLETESYYQMREIARSVLGDLVTFVRNPCPGCYEGNDANGLGDPIEMHRPEDLPNLNPGDGFTLDGTGVTYPGEIGHGGIALSDAMELAAFSVGRSIGYFGLWRFERQGLISGNLTHPDDRIYEVPTDQQSDQEIQLLRHGLSPVATPLPESFD